jgi:hypothetical protein
VADIERAEVGHKEKTAMSRAITMMIIPKTAPRFFFRRRHVSDCMELFSFNQLFHFTVFPFILSKTTKTACNHSIEDMKGLA